MKIAILCSHTKKDERLDKLISYCKKNYIIDTTKDKEMDANGVNIIVLFKKSSEFAYDIYTFDNENALFFHEISTIQLNDFSCVVVFDHTDNDLEYTDEYVDSLLTLDNETNVKNYNRFISSNFYNKRKEEKKEEKEEKKEEEKGREDNSLYFEYSNLFKDGKLYGDFDKNMEVKNVVKKIFENNQHLFGQASIPTPTIPVTDPVVEETV
jgi:hypothetical protein